MSFFPQWKKELPGVAASLTTAAIIFLVSTVAYRFRDVLYPPYEGLDYPLICTAEAYPDVPAGKLIVEFYIVNRTDQTFSEEKLIGNLREAAKGTDARLSPAILLNYSRSIGTLESAKPDLLFNGDKGELVAEVVRDQAVSIKVREIKPYAILRVVISVSGLRDIERVTRATKVDIPLDFRPYQRGCYSR